MRLLGRDDLTDSKPAAGLSTDLQTSLEEEIKKLLSTTGKTVSLISGNGSLGEDILLILLGQQQLRSNTAVAGNEIMDGLRTSGHNIIRADNILRRHTETGHIVATGKRRRRRYWLTSDGIAKASRVARRLASSTPPQLSE